ncbi:putative AlkP superfamily pyrophosphatase or phosphodiesterase [Motilibacter peucedani]|uniref:Putative AlkP superfamily pyrophosphatase or phosphodiesterase n=1 Tax=Motilibacter peucedani TaxID=598650 RepID=A0A420XRU1_9ACTN|nr:nucleotide pyrophosphatase/phosphodiesterase family protein [Motilibacter peucedani]RKS77613.1 putative AlkP superfamily pyrophosphatase or phosphodiesterase [Motilibacter peucedani]
MTAFAAPPYGAGTLSDLLPAVLASLGVAGEPDVLGLEPAQRACVLLVDGLGAEQLAAATGSAPNLAALSGHGRTLHAGFPTTTATSIASVLTGAPPGEHGLTALAVAVPGTDELLNLLRWRDEVDPGEWQPLTTAFERAGAAGVTATAVLPRSFHGSGLTSAVFRGGALRAGQSAGEVVAAAASALAASDRALVYAYYGELDATGHRSGAGSEAWRLQLAHLDLLVGQLVDRLPAGTALHVTADHGMVDVDPADCVDVDTETALRDGVRVLAGEPRARFVHTRPGALADVAATWREVLGTRASVLLRDEAVAAGWFGPRVREEVLERIGDLVVAAHGRSAVLASRAEPWQQVLVGHHGSLTDAERLVPLLTARPR